MRCLKEKGLFEPLRARAAAGTPLLGICLGMQLLFETGLEHSRTEGLGLIAGEVVPIDGHGEKIPHIGWNSLTFDAADPILDGVTDGAFVYFVHSFRRADRAGARPRAHLLRRADSRRGAGDGERVRDAVPPREEPRRRSAAAGEFL